MTIQVPEHGIKDRIELARTDLITRTLRWLDPTLRRSARRFEPLRDRYRGTRCFIVGNGPSLTSMDISLLEHETVFALNRGHLLFEELGFPPSFLVSVNRLVIEQSADEIASVPCTKFISWQNRRWFQGRSDCVFFRSITTPRFSTDPVRQGIWEGYTVTYVAMQLAHYMGFSEVVLIGVDHSFQVQGTPNQEVVATGDDQNHFRPDYFGTGYRWHLPDLDNSEVAYRLARHTFDASGRRILDATVNGRLDVFEKVSYESLF